MYSKPVTRGQHLKPKRMHKRKDRRVFSKTADGSQRINSPSPNPSRGGIRL